MNLNKVYEKVINSLIIPKYDFISGIEALKVTKDDIDRVSIRVNFYLKASWAREMFNDDCRRKYIDGRGGSIILDFDDMYKCVLNKFKDEEIFLIDDLTAINKLLGYKTNYFSGGAFDVRFVLDFKN
jgi:hypothetical protein